jgi:cAMP phosphodiesterase
MFAQSYLINDTVAIDAGCLGLLSPVEQQSRVRHVLLSHSHLDHVGTLPIFLENVYNPSPDCPTVYGSAAVLDCLKRDFFNERVWPDLFRISAEEMPFMRFVELQTDEPLGVADLRITPVVLNHVVPTNGFLIDDGEKQVGIVSDTQPTEKIWQKLNGLNNLRGVFLEASFPNSYQWLADKAGHLTPHMFGQEIAKLDRQDISLVAVHLKPRFHEQIGAELLALGLPDLRIGEPNCVYEF